MNLGVEKHKCSLARSTVTLHQPNSKEIVEQNRGTKVAYAESDLATIYRKQVKSNGGVHGTIKITRAARFNGLRTNYVEFGCGEGRHRSNCR